MSKTSASTLAEKETAKYKNGEGGKKIGDRQDFPTASGNNVVDVHKLNTVAKKQSESLETGHRRQIITNVNGNSSNVLIENDFSYIDEDEDTVNNETHNVVNASECAADSKIHCGGKGEVIRIRIISRRIETESSIDSNLNIDESVDLPRSSTRPRSTNKRSCHSIDNSTTRSSSNNNITKSKNSGSNSAKIDRNTLGCVIKTSDDYHKSSRMGGSEDNTTDADHFNDNINDYNNGNELTSNRAVDSDKTIEQKQRSLVNKARHQNAPRSCTVEDQGGGSVTTIQIQDVDQKLNEKQQLEKLKSNQQKHRLFNKPKPVRSDDTVRADCKNSVRLDDDDSQGCTVDRECITVNHDDGVNGNHDGSVGRKIQNCVGSSNESAHNMTALPISCKKCGPTIEMTTIIQTATIETNGKRSTNHRNRHLNNKEQTIVPVNAPSADDINDCQNVDRNNLKGQLSNVNNKNVDSGNMFNCKNRSVTSNNVMRTNRLIFEAEEREAVAKVIAEAPVIQDKTTIKTHILPSSVVPASTTATGVITTPTSPLLATGKYVKTTSKSASAQSAISSDSPTNSSKSPPATVILAAAAAIATEPPSSSLAIKNNLAARINIASSGYNTKNNSQNRDKSVKLAANHARSVVGPSPSAVTGDLDHDTKLQSKSNTKKTKMLTNTGDEINAIDTNADIWVRGSVGNGVNSIRKCCENDEKSIENVQKSVVQKNKGEISAEMVKSNCTNEVRGGSDVKITECGLNDRLLRSDLNEDDNDDPYSELESYLERVKREINEVFEHYRLNDELPRSTIGDSTISGNKLSEQLQLSKKETRLCQGDTRNSNVGFGTCVNSVDKKSSTIIDSSTSCDCSGNSRQNYTNGCTRNAIATMSTKLSDCDQKERELKRNEFHPKRPQERGSCRADDNEAEDNISDGCNNVFVGEDEKDEENGQHKYKYCQHGNLQLNQHHQHQSLNQVHENRQLQHRLQRHQEELQRRRRLYRMASLHRSISDIKAHDPNDVNVWANTILKELDNLMGSDKRSSAKSAKDHVVTANNEKNRTRINSNILKPEKHTTIPLYSFNLDRPILESNHSVNSKKPPIDTNYARKSQSSSSISINSNSNNSNSISSNLNNGTSKFTSSNRSSTTNNKREDSEMLTVLKIEEDAENDGNRESIRAVPLNNGSYTKKEAHSHQTTPTTATPAQLMLNDTTKKGSTSTIWTSEESILRSVGAVDEDNKSTSSSASDEASGVLSSGKSGNSLNSSELDNDNVESGIGTATPPKDCDSWKIIRPNLQHRQNSIGNQMFSPHERAKLCKSNSVASSDEHDYLEVLSQYDGVNEEDDLLSPDYDTFLCICNSTNKSTDDCEECNVMLREKPKMESSGYCRNFSLPVQNIKKARSHSMETPQFPLFRHEFELHDKEYKSRRPCCLPISQEPFQGNLSTNIRELPSPSSASLHSGHGNLALQELTTKSNSAPILLKNEKRKDDFCTHQNSLRYSRSQSDRYLAEIEAIEASKWLRAAGFPQYAQMYEDLQFPIDLTNVAKDHPILENDQLQSLYRRLCILNRCATMRLDSGHKQHTQQKEDSDDEGCALSENWTFQPQIRRWSRIGEMGLEIPSAKQLLEKDDCSSKDSSPDRFDDELLVTTNMDLATSPLNPKETNNDSEAITVRFRRTGSERLKDGAKAFLRRVESIKSRRRKRQNREGLVISGPHVLDLSQMNQKVTDLKCVNVTTYSTPPSPLQASPLHFPPRSPFNCNELKVPDMHLGFGDSGVGSGGGGGNERFLSPNRLSPKHIPTTPRSAHSMRTSPLHFFASTMPHLREGKSDDSSSYCSDSQESSSGSRHVILRRHASRSRRFLQRSGKVDDIGALSDSECHNHSSKTKMIFKDANSNNTEVNVTKLTRGGSLNLGKESKRYRDAFQTRSFRTRTTGRKNQKTSESDKEDIKISKSPVVRWHSFQTDDRPLLLFKKCYSEKVDISSEGTPFAALSSGQLQVIRKLALVTLTGYMERYCPSHRSGWNWELPKFIKKIKTPDYKDKKVFGVPLLLVVQRTGYSLPKSIRSALKWLNMNALDQIGLFRKSGVKSRISKLKEQLEANDEGDCVEIFEAQQAYDIADMLKQYFRDLPESLLTTKMSETFVAIFQHLPPDTRPEAVQSAVLLLPDEHREVLFVLLKFLNYVARNSPVNQMTANNLAVCLAPSLFNNTISTGRSNSVSPRRRKATGIPDAKELSETRASHECLSFLISHYEQVFTVSLEKMSKYKFSCMEESKPVPLEALGKEMQFHNWRGYLYECTTATIKEGRERPRGWMTISSMDPNIEIAYKKVGDGHPLRLWRFLTEVDAPPNDVLNYILRERKSWDTSVLQCRTIEKLDESSEIYQYACDGPTITDYCVLRSWQRILPRDACVIVETSVDHSTASTLLSGVRGVVLASRYLIEPYGNGRSKIMYLARVDTKGRTPEWYNKSYGHICSHHLSRIRAAFKRHTDSPESKV